MHLGLNLTSAQQNFLRDYNFLPHRYISMKEERDLLSTEIKSLEIKLTELVASNELEQHKIHEDKLLVKAKRITTLDKQILEWEMQNPHGGNPADATEYLSESLELKEWLINHKVFAEQKKQMFEIICQQMVAALKQMRQGRNFPQEDFGHFEEKELRFRIKQKKEKRKSVDNKSGGLKVESKHSKPLFRAASGMIHKQEPVKAVRTIAKSSKLKERSHEPKEIVVTPKEERKKKSEKFSDILAEKEKLDKAKNLTSEKSKQKKKTNSYNDIRKRIAEQQVKGKEINTKEKSAPNYRWIAVVAIIVLAGLTLVYALM
jgi:hypothetical protein